MLKKIGVFLFLSVSTTAVSAQQFGTHENCMLLTEVAENTFHAKEGGSSVEDTTNAIKYLLSRQSGVSPVMNAAAEGVVFAIYGDNKIKSAKQAGDTVYEACFNQW